VPAGCVFVYNRAPPGANPTGFALFKYSPGGKGLELLMAALCRLACQAPGRKSDGTDPAKRDGSRRPSGSRHRRWDRQTPRVLTNLEAWIRRRTGRDRGKEFLNASAA